MLNFLLVPETLARDVLHSVCNLMPRVKVLPVVGIIAPPDLTAADTADSSAVSRAGWHVWFALESVQSLDDIECGPKAGGWRVC